MRTFIAIPVEATPELRTVLSRLKELGGPLKTVSSSDLHLTLKFLGETDATDIASLSQAMTDCFQRQPPESLQLSGLGAFPRIERPNVVWAGMQEYPALMSLAEGLESACEALGYPRETRSFHPHITLSRVKGRPPARLASVLSEYAESDLGRVEVSEICLFQSELGRSGPVYTVLSSATTP